MWSSASALTVFRSRFMGAAFFTLLLRGCLDAQAWSSPAQHDVRRRPSTTNWRPSTRFSIPRTSPLSRIVLGVFQGSVAGGLGRSSAPPSLPRDVKEAVASCREAVQRALQDRKSRMRVDFPVGAKFGVERGEVKGKNRSLSGSRDDGNPTKLDLDRSDRELARLFVEMFQPVGGDRLLVAFNDAGVASLARKKWEDDHTADCQVVSLNRRKDENRAVKPKGFAAKMAAEIDADDGGPLRVPSTTEVVLFVAPGPKELVTIERICEEVGMGTLVVLLNARLSSDQSFGSAAAKRLFNEDFESVFLLAAAPQVEAPGCIMYRAYPNDWSLGRKPKIGPPKTIMSSSQRPTNDDCRSAFAALTVSDFEKGLEYTMESISSWFR